MIQDNIDPKYKRELVQLFSAAEKRNLMTEFIDYLLSPGEIRDFSTRIQVMKRLLKRQNHRQVAKNFNIGIGTVTRGARALKEHRKTIDKLGIKS